MTVETIVTSVLWSCLVAMVHNMGDVAVNVPQGDVIHWDWGGGDWPVNRYIIQHENRS